MSHAVRLNDAPTCPWCGSQPMLVHRVHAGASTWHFVHCAERHCPVQPETKRYRTPEEAIEAWNLCKED